MVKPGGAANLAAVAANTVPTDDAARHQEQFERILALWYEGWQAAFAATNAMSTLGNLGRFRRTGLAALTSAASIAYTIASAVPAKRARKVTAEKAWADVGAMCLFALVSNTVTRRDDDDRWRNWPKDHLMFHVEVAGVGLRTWPQRVAAVSLMSGTLALRQRRRGDTARDIVAQVLTMAVRGFVMHAFTDLTRHLARRLETADREAVAEAARLGRARIRARHHRSAHERALHGLRRIAVSADPADTALRAACAGDAARLRSVLMHEDACPAQTALLEVVESVSARGINVELVIGDVAAMPDSAAQDLALKMAAAMSRLPSGTRLLLHADCDGRTARAGIRVSPAGGTAGVSSADVSVTW